MMVQERRPQSGSNAEKQTETSDLEAGCLYALITGKRSVSRRNRASWYLRQLNKSVECDPLAEIENDLATTRKDEEATPRSSSASPESNQNSQNKQHNDKRQQQQQQGEDPQSKEIYCVSMTDLRPNFNTNYNVTDGGSTTVRQEAMTSIRNHRRRYLVTPNTRVMYLSKSIATSIVLDLSPSVVTVSAQNDCVYLDSMFDALKRVLHLLVRAQEIPSSMEGHQFVLEPKVFISVIAYTPFIVAKNNQVLVQNRRISTSSLDQVLAEIWNCLNRLTQEIHELVTNNCGINLDYEPSRANAFNFPHQMGGSSAVIRHPGSVLEDIYELGLFSASLMPRLSRLSIVIITDGLFSSTNNLNAFRLRSIALSFVSLGSETVHPDACFGYTPYTDLMRFVAKSTQGVYISHSDLIDSCRGLDHSTLRVALLRNPLYKLFCWSLHSETVGGSGGDSDQLCSTPKACNLRKFEPSIESVDMRPLNIAKFFCVDQPADIFQTPSVTYGNSNGNSGDATSNSSSNSQANLGDIISNYHDWRSFRQLDRNLDADFEQVLSCLLREGYLIKSIQFKHREASRIVARLVLHWKHNLDLEQELTAPYWSNADPMNMSESNNLILRPFNTPIYGDTYCEIFVHGSYSFLHNLYCSNKAKRRSEYKDIAYRQFRQLIDSVLQTHERLQYLSLFYRDSSLSKVPPFLLDGNSLLYEQPHTHKLTSTFENVIDEAKTSKFQEYWQKISCLETKSWKNLMHVHTLRLILEHDQPKHKNIQCQNANGRYTHIQCRRSLSAISNFIKSYASFALLEDTTYIKFIYNKDDDLREIETSATKGFIVIRINKLLPIIVIYLMFTSGILDSHRVEIVSYLEEQLKNCKIRGARQLSSASMPGNENILKSKTICPSSESCCVLIKSPLERMLKVYSRNFMTSFLAQNLAHGLPGSCSYSMQHHQNNQHQQPILKSHGNKQQATVGVGGQFQSHSKQRDEPTRDYTDDCAPDGSTSRYNLVFGKYLYGVRMVHSIFNLPHDLAQSLASNVLAKISGILVNIRIKQGFHIAFNNSGILNLVVELAMRDRSHEFLTSSCLCQYIVFPPAVTSCPPQGVSSAAVTTTDPYRTNNPQLPIATGAVQPIPGASSSSGATNGGKPAVGSAVADSLSGSWANSEQSFLKNPVVTPREEASSFGLNGQQILQNEDIGEVKVIREYWIEQQYGVSSGSLEYHRSLQDMRYAQIVDHLFLTDSTIFECLLTYDLLQLLCDKLSPFYELDLALANREAQTGGGGSSTEPAFSPTSSTSSSNILDPHTPTGCHSHQSSPNALLPSHFLEGSTKEANSKIPLLELEYNFCLAKFLGYCQQASLNVLLFRDKSDFYEPPPPPPVASRAGADEMAVAGDEQSLAARRLPDTKLVASDSQPLPPSNRQAITCRSARKMSVDVGYFDGTEYGRREYRSSYDNLNSTSNSYALTSSHNSNTATSPTLNHVFLDTLHKRLKQMHDKELKLSLLDRQLLPAYLKRRKLRQECGDHIVSGKSPTNAARDSDDDDTADCPTNKTEQQPPGKLLSNGVGSDDSQIPIDWRCFLRKGNQENFMIVLVPASVEDVTKWLDFIEEEQCIGEKAVASDGMQREEPQGKTSSGEARASRDTVCPIFVFRCSSSMINDHVSSILKDNLEHYHQLDPTLVATCRAEQHKQVLESDLSLHFGQPCMYMKKLFSTNDELESELLPLNRFNNGISGQTAATGAMLANSSDEKTLEIVHFRAFLRKIKNTVLKSRFSSLNDAYLSELFLHKSDVLYYMDNVDLDTQKKYHVPSQLRSLAEFIKNYEDYQESLPREQSKECNQLLNSILLQKCGLFINQPIARYNEANPLMKQLHDRKLLFLMRCNYKIELPILEDNLANSAPLRQFVHQSSSSSTLSHNSHHHQMQQQQQLHRHHHRPIVHNRSHNWPASIQATGTNLSSSINESSSATAATMQSYSGGNPLASSLGRSEAGRFVEMRCGSMGATVGGPAIACGSPSAIFNERLKLAQTPRFSSSSTLSSLPSPTQDSFILEAFKGSSCPIDEISSSLPNADSLMDAQMLAASPSPPLTQDMVSLRHEAHMAEVLRRKSQRKESHHYRRVLKSKTNYNQSHGAIDQALKRVDSLGRLEHFCLTPLLFSPSWRSHLAPVRDHTIATTPNSPDTSPRCDLNNYASRNHQETCGDTRAANDGEQQQPEDGSLSSLLSNGHQMALAQQQQEAEERWHQMVCNNYIKEYEQYIQTLGFNSVQIRYHQTNTGGLSSSKGNVATAGQNFTGPGSGGSPRSGGGSGMATAGTRLRRSSRTNAEAPPHHYGASQHPVGSSAASSYSSKVAGGRKSSASRRESLPATAVGGCTSSMQSLASAQNSSGAYNTGYLIKFLNSGCLVFKVGFCKPYVYSILYSIEGERFNNSSNLKMNMTAFLDELDNIKVTMHLHSFTYDYHLRSMYSYIAGRQMTFSPGYHLISFVDDFRKYYQKAPNYARNHILSGEVSITDIKVTGQQLYNYIVTHNSVYNLGVLEMSSSSSLAANVVRTLAAAASSSSSSSLSGSKDFKQASTLSSLINQANQQQQVSASSHSKDDSGTDRSHANNYVLIELKREKVRYRDGKDPDVFECGLLITHDVSAARNCNHNYQTSTSSSSSSSRDQQATRNCLTLKYFLLLTNQRDLYPKLIHCDDNIISLGCHRPIRLGLNQLTAAVASTAAAAAAAASSAHSATTVSTSPKGPARRLSSSKAQTGGGLRGDPPPAPASIGGATKSAPFSHSMGAPSDQEEAQSLGELLSSGEVSQPQSIVSFANSIQSANSTGLQFGAPLQLDRDSSSANEQLASFLSSQTTATDESKALPPAQQSNSAVPTEMGADALVATNSGASVQGGRRSEQDSSMASSETGRRPATISSQQTESESQYAPSGASQSDEPESGNQNEMDLTSSKRDQNETPTSTPSAATMTRGGQNNLGLQPTNCSSNKLLSIGGVNQERAICDEEITYLGYFSSDEMDMLRFLQEKTTNLRGHIERIVRLAEVHYRRDYLWHKLMQRAEGNKTDQQLPLSVEEFLQLLPIVESLDLTALDSKLSLFTTMHISWYLKLIKAFNELKQSSVNQHRIYIVKASKILLIFMDPKCTTAFILLSVDSDRGSVEMSILLKDKQDLATSGGGDGGGGGVYAKRSSPSKLMATSAYSAWTGPLELDQDCQLLINDFVNFCATFMWSSLL